MPDNQQRRGSSGSASKSSGSASSGRRGSHPEKIPAKPETRAEKKENSLREPNASEPGSEI
jgi:hypothetical protein